MRTITLEEHFAPPGFLDGPGRQLKEAQLKGGPRGEKIIEQLADVGDRQDCRNGCGRHRHASAVPQCSRQ